MATPPPLPPRTLPAMSTSPPSPPQFQDAGLLATSLVGIGYSTNLHASDPRTSSSQSLIAPAHPSDTRRSLLIIYIHGFYGNDQSFRSFPAHAHAFLTELLSETHIVHSKIYPRYKTYKAIQVARDNFSAWLEPHESTTTDVILVGHSMGGLLAAEVVLMPNHDPNLHQPYKHRILGTLSLDSPFLGLHPGIVVSGLSSLFQPAPQPEKETVGSASESSLSVDPSTSDLLLPLSDTTSSASVTSPPPTQTNELYDPPFFNDVPFREKPLFSRLRNFASKHRAEGIFNALGNHIVSHLEFGGCMADYPELSSRYKRIRALEDVDELKAISEGHPAAAHRRVRFVNYYTLSPGRPKPSPQMVGLRVDSPSSSTLSLNQPETDSKEPGEPKTEIESNPIQETQQPPHLTQAVSIAGSDGEDLYEADEPKPGLDGKPNAETLSKYNDVDDEDISEHEGRMSMLHLDPTPMVEETDEAPMASEGASMPPTGEIQPSFDLAPIPPMPEEPTVHDLTKYTDKDARKQAEKEAKREQKAYQQAIKDRNKAIREREKLLEKRRKKSEKEAQRLEKESIREAQELARQRDEAAAAARAEHASADAAAATAAPGTSPPPQHPPPPQQQQQPKKLRKFCALPRRDDATWVDIYMADVDEVGAHCGLFTPGAHYDKLVGDVGTRIMAWVHEDLSTRAALDMQ